MLWQDAVKTLFDPCPAGWRVPLSGEGNRSVWSAVTTDNGIWNGAIGKPEGGYHYHGISTQGSPWYPASGFYMPVGSLSGMGYWLHNWSSTAINDMAFCFRISYTDFTPNASNVRNHGLSVRCVRE